MGRGHSHTPAGKNKKRLVIVLALTTTYLVAEVVGGLLTHSLALLADAGHMLTDVAGLGLALMAIRFAERPATPERTYGYYRVEILAALANSVVFIGISVYILYEAYQRFRNPPEVQSTAMLAVASVGRLRNSSLIPSL
ncbi:MAG: cation diffusion facilitator family transporter [Pyrinomonadaceae bacterium]|nr:cation diffusion facilitator family transporter [Pyrinomonadaceae bacterium]